jgi:hypothetical protein
MAITTSLVFDIRPIARVQRCDGQVQLTFRDVSVARLEGSHMSDRVCFFAECLSLKCFSFHLPLTP